MNHITLEQSTELFSKVDRDISIKPWDVRLNRFATAVIEWYIEQSSIEYAAHKYELELPEGDTRKVKVWWSGRTNIDNQLTHKLSISVDETPSTLGMEPELQKVIAERDALLAKIDCLENKVDRLEWENKGIGEWRAEYLRANDFLSKAQKEVLDWKKAYKDNELLSDALRKELIDVKNKLEHVRLGQAWDQLHPGARKLKPRKSVWKQNLNIEVDKVMKPFYDMMVKSEEVYEEDIYDAKAFKPLSLERIAQIINDTRYDGIVGTIRAVEAAHGIK